ncbi:unnamed protein product, partial [Didymodactylos carnosus]
EDKPNDMKKRLSNDVTSALYRDDQMMNNYYGQNNVTNGSAYSNAYRNTPPPMQQQQIHEPSIMNYYSSEAGLGIDSDREIQVSPLSSVNIQNDDHHPAPAQVAAWFDTDL